MVGAHYTSPVFAAPPVLTLTRVESGNLRRVPLHWTSPTTDRGPVASGHTTTAIHGTTVDARGSYDFLWS